MRRTVMIAVLSAVVGALVAVPVAVYASHSFIDVPDSNTFHEDIAWLADAGVTKGCNPPDNTEFCPKDEVTREQMAAFLHRLAANQVVDAGTLQGQTAAELTAAAAVPILEFAAGDGIDEDGGWNTADPDDKTALLTVTLEAPSDGRVVVTGFGQISRGHVQGELDNIVLDVTDGFARIR